jgi:hypothetical protein
MFTRWAFIAILILNLWLCLVARAAMIDFTIEGVVTESTRPDVSVGDPFTIRYSADPEDLDADTSIGRFRTTGESILLPNITFTTQSDGNFYVVFDESAEWVRHRSGFAGFPWTVDIQFPFGTLASDALPPTLPLSGATSATLIVWDNTTFMPPFPVVVGTVTSYVPEPYGLCVLTSVATLLRRWRGR